MSYHVSLAPYVVKVREKGSDEDLPLGSFFDTHSVSEGIEHFLEGLRLTLHDNPDAQRVIAHIRHDLVPPTLYGLVQAGQYGTVRAVLDMQTRSEDVKLKLLRHHADTLNYYFQFLLPAHTTRGVLIMQRSGSRSIASEFIKLVKAHFVQRFPQHRLHIEKLVPHDMIERLLREGAVEEIGLVTYHVPERTTDRMLMDGIEESVGTYVRVVKPKRGARLKRTGWLSAIVRGKAVAEIAELREADVDDVYVDLELHGKSRRIYPNREKGLSPSFDITDLVALDDGNNPTFASIHYHATDLARDLIQQLQGELDPE